MKILNFAGYSTIFGKTFPRIYFVNIKSITLNTDRKKLEIVRGDDIAVVVVETVGAKCVATVSTNQSIMNLDRGSIDVCRCNNSQWLTKDTWSEVLH